MTDKIDNWELLGRSFGVTIILGAVITVISFFLGIVTMTPALLILSLSTMVGTVATAALAFATHKIGSL
jgi:Mg/Co/Ni transporter MgtE